MSQISDLTTNENFNVLFSEIADDLAEAINGGHHACHQQSDDSVDPLDRMYPPSYYKQQSKGNDNHSEMIVLSL